MRSRTSFFFCGPSLLLRLLVVAAILLLPSINLLPIQAATPTIHYVNASAPSGGSGTSWATAYSSLQSALTAAVNGDQVWVAAGTYRPTSRTVPPDSRSVTFQLKSGVAVYGGFTGNETSLAQRDWEANTTILSGDIGATGDASDNAYHVVTGSGTNAGAILDGFTVSGGNADGEGDGLCGAECGGGMYSELGSPTLNNLVFNGNYAIYGGGGLYNESGNPALTNVTFAANYAEYEGGGLSNESGIPTLTNIAFSANHAGERGGGMSNLYGSLSLDNATFSDNQAVFGGGLYNDNSSPTLSNIVFNGNQAEEGGGLYIIDGSPTLTDIRFSSNQADYEGGGLYIESGDPVLTDVVFSGNRAENGGGLYNQSGNPVLTDVAFSANQAENGGGLYNEFDSPILSNIVFNGNQADYGGGLYSLDGSPTLTNVSFNGNQANYEGGGLYSGSSLALTNVSFSANQADYGGGMYNGPGNPVLTNVTFNANQAISGGGGVYNFSGSPLLQNSILWGNVAPNNAEISGSNSATIRTSLVKNRNVTTDGNLDGTLPANAPQFVREPDPGPDGDWSTPDDNDYGDLRLQPASPAIDVGDNAADLDGPGSGTTTIADIATDLAGAPRRAALRGLSAIVDLGAYETANQPPAFTSTPVTVATQDVLYSYAVSALDPDPPLGGVLTLAASTLPGWLTFVDHGNGTATLSGTPGSAAGGSHGVVLTVTDLGGQSAGQSFTIVVDLVGVNDAPVFTSTPVTAATVGVLYSYAITTADADAGDTRTITAPSKPAWLTLVDAGDGTAALSGTPTPANIGSHPVQLRVQDVGGLESEQSFVIAVGAAPVLNGSVTGLVFADLNGNGTLDSGEPGVAGVTVKLQTAPGVTHAQTVTDGAGGYHFETVPPAGYTLVVEPPTGYTLPQPPTRTLTVSANQVTTVPDYPLGVVSSGRSQHIPIIRG